MSLPVSVLRRRRQAILPALSAFGGRFSRRAFQHRVLCAADDDGGAGDGPEARRLRALVRRRPPLFQPPGAGPAAADAPDPGAAGDEAQSGCEGYLCLPLRRFRARRLRPAPAYQGRGRGVSAPANARPEIVLIVAVADNGVIGARGSIPWRLKSDQQRLKAMTMGKPGVMGLQTFVPLNHPLPRPPTFVVTPAPGFR